MKISIRFNFIALSAIVLASCTKNNEDYTTSTNLTVNDAKEQYNNLVSSKLSNEIEYLDINWSDYSIADDAIKSSIEFFIEDDEDTFSIFNTENGYNGYTKVKRKLLITKDKSTGEICQQILYLLYNFSDVDDSKLSINNYNGYFGMVLFQDISNSQYTAYQIGYNIKKFNVSVIDDNTKKNTIELFTRNGESSFIFLLSDTSTDDVLDIA